METTSQKIIQQTKNWLDEIVIGLELCPFADKVVQNNSIDFTVIDNDNLEQHLHSLSDGFSKLDELADIETSLIIFPNAYINFEDYLELLLLGNLLLEDLNYIGTYQLASFHPHYRFDETEEDDASNFSNRSPYPMLHILRESSVELAIKHYDNIDDVPEQNIKRLKKIGFEKMQNSLQNILNKKT